MKFALIGCGAQGLAYASAAAELGFDMAVCADPRAASAKKAAARCRARATTVCASTIEHTDIDGVVLCAPSGAIPGHLRLAAKCRKHVLISSPLAAAARKAFEAARAAGIHVYVAHDTRVAPELAAIAAQLDQGAIGRPGFIRIFRAGASPDAPSGAGALVSLMSGDLDWLAGRFGAGPRLFAQRARAPGLEHVSLTLTFTNGPIVQWTGTCRARGESPRASIEVCGDAGMIQFSTDDLVLESSPNSGNSTQFRRRESPVAASFAARHLERFAALIGSQAAGETYDHELDVLRLFEAVSQSARTGREVRL